ncbi:MAG: type II toxin-antitoxin system Phd/YefM family antitoxin [Sulfurimonas sp.]|uniref:type II toxin-antitoxin system Phd/YefM family antitoxin n=1 Tax=Sulfurimonas sp. TaxID=2022749 RepID=UPI0026358D9E|nr:type II toxin-antitoxin system Phd/YefM family antitoxin [Sulfurimonas sp.]MDD5401629.1 type II toxin-antitoxin system Phd/YefM family antitoxin [Sulfurimonas sp.]
MIRVMSVSEVRANIYNVMDETAQSHEPVLITGKRNNVVMLSLEDWNAIEETLYLNSIPNLASSIQDSMKSDDSEFSEDIEW